MLTIRKVKYSSNDVQRSHISNQQSCFCSLDQKIPTKMENLQNNPKNYLSRAKYLPLVWFDSHNRLIDLNSIKENIH